MRDFSHETPSNEVWSGNGGSRAALAPGSKVVSDYLDRAGLTDPLESLGFQTVGYGCTTCIGNSGPLPQEVADTVTDHDLAAALRF